MGLLYKKNTAINFCPKCKTGLAEEEVLANGTHERCGTKIIKKELEIIFDKISSPKKKVILLQSDHFFSGTEGEVGEEVKRFFSLCL